MEFEIIQNDFLITRMIEFLDIRDKCLKSGLEAPLTGGIGERKRWRAREGKWREKEEWQVARVSLNRERARGNRGRN